MVWECSSLAGASPALVAAAPVLFLGQPLLDNRATTRRYICCVHACACVRVYLRSENVWGCMCV